MSGFRKTGVYPVDPSKYPQERFDPIKLRRYKETHRDSPYVKEIPIDVNLIPSEQDPDTNLNVAVNVDQISTESNSQINVSSQETIPAKPLASFATPSTSSAIPSTSSASLAPVTPKRSFEELLLLKVSPKQNKPKEKRRKFDTKAVVITSDDYAEKIKRQDDKKKKEI